MPPTPRRASSFHLPSRLEPIRRPAGSRWLPSNEVTCSGMRPSSERSASPHLESVAPRASVDADFQHVEPGQRETNGLAWRQHGPGVVRDVRDDGLTCRTAQQQIQIFHRGVAGGVDAVALVRCRYFERVAVDRILRGLVTELNFCDGAHPPCGPAIADEPGEIAL